MRRLLVIGIGVGNPAHLTVEAIEALNEADVFFLPDKGSEKAGLRQLRLDICERYIRETGHRFVNVGMPKRAKTESYLADVDDWHQAIAEGYERLFLDELREGEVGALLVWGDPSLYDSTLRILGRLGERGVDLDYRVIPGISSVQVLTARHGIALNGIGEPVLLTTGRRLSVDDGRAFASIVVLLDGELAFRRLEGEDLDIYWGAYLGTADEVLVSGRLADVADEIEALRARLREAKGWIMDSYLLRRREPAR
jgi:precorrin-6A synthase